MRDRMQELKDKVEAGGKMASVMEENRYLKAQLSQTVQQLEDARKTKGLVIPNRTEKQLPDTFARLFVTDTHGSHADVHALSAFFSDIAGVDIREIVFGGDGLECGGWLMQSHALGYVAQLDEVCYEEDVAAANDLLDRLQSTCPKAKIYYMEGNHEWRVERWCVDICEGHKRNAEFLMRAIAPYSVLNLEKRGIEYFRRSDKYCGLDTPGVLKLGKSFFVHESSTASHAASKALDKFAGCVFYGHTHRADFSTTRLVNVGLVSAWNPGCMCVLQPRWRHSDPTGWTHGYMLQIVNRRDDTFHAVHVPIYKGRSYLNTLLKTVK